MSAKPFDPKTYRATQRAGTSPLHREAIQMMKDQLLIVFLNRLGGEAVVPVSEVDGTGDFNLALSLDVAGGKFTFKTERKQ